MIRFSCVRSGPIVLALVTAAGWATMAAAQSAPTAPDDTRRLTDLQRMQILDTNTAASAAAARGEQDGSDLDERGIHGEMGVMIGSHGARGAYGVAEIPLGDSARATVAVESSRYGDRR